MLLQKITQGSNAKLKDKYVPLHLINGQ